MRVFLHHLLRHFFIHTHLFWLIPIITLACNRLINGVLLVLGHWRVPLLPRTDTWCLSIRLVTVQVLIRMVWIQGIQINSLHVLDGRQLYLMLNSIRILRVLPFFQVVVVILISRKTVIYFILRTVIVLFRQVVWQIHQILWEPYSLKEYVLFVFEVGWKRHFGSFLSEIWEINDLVTIRSMGGTNLDEGFD